MSGDATMPQGDYCTKQTKEDDNGSPSSSLSVLISFISRAAWTTVASHLMQTVSRVEDVCRTIASVDAELGPTWRAVCDGMSMYPGAITRRIVLHWCQIVMRPVLEVVCGTSNEQLYEWFLYELQSWHAAQQPKEQSSIHPMAIESDTATLGTIPKHAYSRIADTHVRDGLTRLFASRMSRPRFFNLTTNWSAFYRAWQTDEVQDLVDISMTTWCAKHAYYEHTDEHGAPFADGRGMRRPVWRRGRAIWSLSASDYWCQRGLNHFNKVNADGSFDRQLRRALERVGIRYPPDDDPENNNSSPLYESRFYQEGMELITDEVMPKPGTLESLMLSQGQNMLLDACAAATQLLFPNRDTHQVEIEETSNGSHDLVVVRNLVEWPFVKQVVDTSYYHYWKNEADHSMLDLICKIV